MSRSSRYARAAGRRGFTLMEILIATALTLLLMAAVVRLFASVTSSVSDSRAIIEIAQQLQSAQIRLQNDLRYATAKGQPPLDPADQLGYLEIVEGPGPYAITGLGTRPIKVDEGGAQDLSVGDMDDVLMMTVRSFGEPFYGRWWNPTTNTQEIIQSQDAEIAWFTRGNKLHRRVRLISPARVMEGAGLSGPATDTDLIGQGFQRRNDTAVRLDLTYGDQRLGQTSYNLFTASSLGDLTKRENRFGHYPFLYPHDARFWGAAGLPTQGDTSHIFNMPGSPTLPAAGPWTEPMPWGFCGDDPLNVNGNIAQPDTLTYHQAVDYWLSPFQELDLSGTPVAPRNLDVQTGALLERSASGPNNSSRTLTGARYVNNDPSSPDAQTSRFSEDVILDNVLSFDVKVWDPGAPLFTGGANRVVRPGDADYLTLLNAWIANGENTGDATFVRFGAYVDLFFGRTLGTLPSNSQFAGPGAGALNALSHPSLAAVYDTGSSHYEQDGIDQDGDGFIDERTDGIDNDGNGLLDDFDPIVESETIPPYPFALRSLQVKIRVFERDSQQIREVTVSHEMVQ